VKLAEARVAPLWWDAVDASVTRASLDRDLSVDVAIIGAGFTGLWTAYYLKREHPDLSVVVLEKDHVGFGASGRNGGWCHAEYPLGIGVLAHDHGPSEAVRFMQALHATVDEVGSVMADEGIDCHWAKGGVLAVARSELHMDRARAEVEEAQHFGLAPEDVRLLGAAEARGMLGATDVVGGTWSPHGAAMQPALAVHGLAQACESRGVVICEASAALEIGAGKVATAGGTVSASMIVRATEGFTSGLPGHKRTMVPLYSHMVATEPLSDDLWAELGLDNRATFGDFRNLIIYGQRTADGRFAFGGRGAPYHFGSSISPSYDGHDRVHKEIVRVLLELFPQLSDAMITHRWGGALGAPRDWRPTVSIDRRRGLAWAGGYVGDGVATTNLAGQCLADLITETKSDLVTLPWIQHKWKTWEPEPLRWVGINAGLWMAKTADASEERTGKPSRWGDVGNWLRGKTR